MALEDSRFLIHPERYDTLSKSMSSEMLSQKKVLPSFFFSFYSIDHNATYVKLEWDIRIDEFKKN